MALHAGHMRASTQPLKLTEGSVGSLQNKMRNVWGEPLYIYIYMELYTCPSQGEFLKHLKFRSFVFRSASMPIIDRSGMTRDLAERHTL